VALAAAAPCDSAWRAVPAAPGLRKPLDGERMLVQRPLSHLAAAPAQALFRRFEVCRGCRRARPL